jgi:hypothetical protein
MNFNSDKEEEELSDIVQTLTFKLKDMLKKRHSSAVIKRTLKRAFRKIKSQYEKIGMDDPELNTFLSKLRKCYLEA